MPKDAVCPLCREPFSETGPSVERAGTESGRALICPTCAELAKGGFWGTLALINRVAAAIPLNAELNKLSAEVGMLRPLMRFRIRSFMTGIVPLAGLLAVPIPDISRMFTCGLPAVAILGGLWLRSHGYRELGSCLLFGSVWPAVVVFDLVPRHPSFLTGLSPYTLTLLGALWTWVFLSIIVGGVRCWRPRRLTESANSEP